MSFSLKAAMKRVSRASLGVAAVILLLSEAQADDFHYRNILIGEQAAGMGGAYLAVSDDPSGMFHNPAGILFSLENYFSLSANTYSHSVQIFKNVVAGQDYKYTSSGLVPNFFGFTQNYRKSKWGFAIAVPNSDSFDQDDEITGISSTPGLANSLYRKFYQKNETYYIGPAFATELFKDVSVGLTLFGVYRSFNRIDNQTVLLNGGQYELTNSTFRETSFGVKPKLGVQYMPIPKVSVAATASKLVNLSSSARSQTIQVDTTDGVADPVITKRDPISKPPAPIELGLGGAYFPNKRMMFSFDYYYYTVDSDNPNVNISTYNVALGTEIFFVESVALRAGLYTNNANTPLLAAGKTNQLPHVDHIGASLAIAVKAPGSSFTLGTSYSQGKGDGQAFGNDPAIHKIEEQSLSVFLTGSYQL